MSETGRKFHQAIVAADNGQSPSSWGDQTSLEEKVVEVTELRKIVTHLEQETDAMKQEMLQTAAERKTLMNDVYRQLKLVQFSLHPQNQTLGYKVCEEGGRSDGLSQVLYQDWNPSVVIRRGPRAYSVSVEHLIHRFSN